MPVNIGKKMSTVLVVGLLFFAPNFGFASMTSTTYQIQWDSLNSGGSDTSSSSSYRLRDSLESGLAGISSSASYRLDSGFRSGIYDPTVFFSLFSQDLNSQVGATALTGTTVTVTSTSGYSTGDYIAIVQDEGLSQISATGKITSIGGSTLIVDFLTTGSSSPTIDGVSDYVYELSGTSLPLSSLSSTTASTGIIGWEVTSDVPSGYSMFVLEDGELRAPAGTPVISDVTDGSVSLGSTEYGAKSSDTTLASSTFDTEDSAFTTSLQQIASRSAVSFKSRDFLTLKSAVDSGIQSNSYSHSLTFIFVGNY